MTTEPQQSGDGGPGLSSPIAHLFAEERHRDLQAREAVFATYNADLGFFERTVLGIVQATGARVTVLADARVNDHDPRAVRNAGVRYLAGVAATASGSAFHPKVNVVVGDERALLVIGSGNLTGAGWHYNAETWTVVTADRTRCPALVPELAAWMRLLVDPVASGLTVSEDAAHRLLAAADLLDALAEEAQRASGALEQTGHRIVHTLHTPILSQLPQADDAGVQELRMYAPFHDTNCAAVRALIRRYAPALVKLAVQDGGRTVLNTEALGNLINELHTGGGPDIQLFEDRESRYRHGKLLEVEYSDGREWSLTGSPNLSAAALLRTCSEGGNIEVGVLTHHAGSIFPAGAPVSLSALTTIAAIGTADDEPNEGSAVHVLLMQAVLRAEGLLVSLARPAPADVTIAVSSGASYDTWTALEVIPAGTTTALLARQHSCSAGDRVRPEWQGEDGIAAGRTIFVTDPLSVLITARDVIRTDRGRDRSPLQLAVDSRLLDLWSQGVVEVATAISTITLRRGAGVAVEGTDPEQTGGEPTAASSDSEQAWLRYTDLAKEHLGRPMVDFVLGGFPRLGSAGPGTALLELSQPTDQLVDEKAAGLEDDNPEVVNDGTDVFESPGPIGDAGSTVATEQPAADQPTIDRGRAITQRARIRTRLADVVEQSPRLHPMARQAAAWLVLIAQQSGVYDGAQGDNGWTRTLTPALAALDHTNADGSSDIPDRLLEAVSSTAAVGLYLLHDALRTNSATADLAHYRQVADSVAHLLPYATTEQVASYAHALLNANGFPVDEEAVLRVAGMAVQADEMNTTIDLLESAHPEWIATKLSPRCLHVRAPRSAPMLLAATALDLLATVEQPIELAACWGTNEKGDWCLLACDQQHLWRVEARHTAPGQELWTHHRLSALVRPLAIAKDQSLASRTREPHGPLIREIPAAIAAFEHCGADVKRPPVTDEV